MIWQRGLRVVVKTKTTGLYILQLGEEDSSTAT